MDLLYWVYFLVNFIVTIFLWIVFVDRIGHINYQFCKAKIDLPIKNNSNQELNFFPQSGWYSDRQNLYDYVLYDSIYKLHICNHIVVLSSLIISITGFLILAFVENVSLILVIAFSTTYLTSILVLTIMTIKVSRLQHTRD